MEIYGNVAVTALAVAMCRAHESSRPDALFRDALAEPLVDAFGPGLKEHFSLSDTTLAELYANIAGRTAFFDTELERHLVSISQVVTLGAGLDTRFHRLGTIPDVHWWEVDQPELLSVKDRTLATLAPETESVRTSVPADLRSGWQTELTCAGYDPHLPTAFIVEGVFSYLSSEQNDALVAAITELSSPRSLLLATHWGPGKQDAAYGKALQEATDQHGVGFQSAVTDPVAWLSHYGWTATPTTLIAQARHFGRTELEPEAPGSEIGWLISATKT